MNVDSILDSYQLDRQTAAQYIEAISRYNQTQTAEAIGVSRQTVSRYKRAFDEMSAQERLLLISALLQERFLEEATK